jgi:hypothetical protein
MIAVRDLGTIQKILSFIVRNTYIWNFDEHSRLCDTLSILAEMKDEFPISFEFLLRFNQVIANI